MTSDSRPPKRRVRPAVIGGATLGGLVVLLGLTARVMWRSYTSARQSFTGFPAAEISRHPERTGITGLAAVSFRSPSGRLISGWYRPSRNGAAVIIVHGSHADRSSHLVEAQLLAAADFGLLAFDWPGFGQSEPDGPVRWSASERAALIAAIGWLSGQPEVDPHRIGAFGMSYGGMVLAQVAARDSRLQAIVLAAVPTELKAQMAYEYRKWWILSSLPAVRAVQDAGVTDEPERMTDLVSQLAPRPLLLVTGDQDPVVPASMARAMYVAAKEPRELWTIAGAGHGNFSAADPTGYGPRLTRFFKGALLDRQLTVTNAVGSAPIRNTHVSAPR